jgi:glycosyltransferase involved in cell wall biosynthesis
VVGDGPERERLQTLARTLDVSQQVRFHGTLSSEGVRNVLQHAHGYVLASHHETFGIPVVEALACGCAVLATRCGGPEYILSGERGRMVAPHSTAALERALLRMTRSLLQNPSRGPTPADRTRLHNRFSYDTFVTRTIDLYQNAKRHWASS